MAQLLPQDVLLAVRLLRPPLPWTFQSLGASIGISQSQCHLAFGRLLGSHLVDEAQRVTIKGNLYEFLIHGVKYVFPAALHGPVTGIPTAHAAPSLRAKLLSSEKERPVWASDHGKVRGREVEPLYKTIPELARHDDWLYSVFAAVDAIRLGRAREREVAATELKGLIYGVD